MYRSDVQFRGRRVVTPDGVREACIHVADGRIERVAPFEDVPSGVPLVEAGDRTILPGVVDTHVHVNEPGRTEWEGFETATRAAAAGGVTHDRRHAAEQHPGDDHRRRPSAEKRAAAGKRHVDFGFWGGVVPGDLGRLREPTPGSSGSSASSCRPGSTSSGVAELDPSRRRAAGSPAFDGLLIVHAELPEPIERATRGPAMPTRSRTART